MILTDIETGLTVRQQKFLNYWRTLQTKTRLPYRKEINPAQFGRALSHVSLAERAEEGFRLRLAGSSITTLFGKDRDTSVLVAMDAETAEAGTASMDLALETGRPVAGSRPYGSYVHCWLRVPLLDDEGVASLVLCLDEMPSDMERRADPEGADQADGTYIAA